MTRPTECKYCGCSEIRSETDSAIHFRCFSSYWHDGDEWNIATNCAAKCAVQLVELRATVQRAVEVLDDITSDAWIEGLNEATRILRGNSPEIPDSSPITTDQLAVSDYYEAVRQRVPWMTSVEHIEGLVEGYRRCGVAVWKTAEEIRKVHGGEYGKAE